MLWEETPEDRQFEKLAQKDPNLVKMKQSLIEKRLQAIEDFKLQQEQRKHGSTGCASSLEESREREKQFRLAKRREAQKLAEAQARAQAELAKAKITGIDNPGGDHNIDKF